MITATITMTNSETGEVVTINGEARAVDTSRGTSTATVDHNIAIFPWPNGGIDEVTVYFDFPGAKMEIREMGG